MNDSHVQYNFWTLYLIYLAVCCHHLHFNTFRVVRHDQAEFFLVSHNIIVVRTQWREGNNLIITFEWSKGSYNEPFNYIYGNSMTLEAILSSNQIFGLADDSSFESMSYNVCSWSCTNKSCRLYSLDQGSLEIMRIHIWIQTSSVFKVMSPLIIRSFLANCPGHFDNHLRIFEKKIVLTYFTKNSETIEYFREKKMLTWLPSELPGMSFVCSVEIFSLK